MWRHVYFLRVRDAEILQQLTVNGCHTIRNISGIFERVRQSVIRHVQACTESHILHTHQTDGCFYSTFRYGTRNEAFSDRCSYEVYVLLCCVELVPKVCTQLMDTFYTDLIGIYNFYLNYILHSLQIYLGYTICI
jgi:hypothetical protein